MNCPGWFSVDRRKTWPVFLKPSLIVPDVTHIDLALLRSLNIAGFLFDLDNTVMRPHSGVVSEPIRQWLEATRQAGFKNAVVSNNKRPEYCKQAEAILAMPVIYRAWKPCKRGFYQGLEMLSLEAHQVAVVGDRPLTDIWGGLRIGAYTILVDPINKGIEPFPIKILRAMERSLILEP